MDAVLEGIVTTQKKEGFNAFIQMGDVVCLMMVIPVLTFIKGDAKSGDTLISRFGGKKILTTHCTDAYGFTWHTKEH
jgi:hypothetical protein